MKKLFLLSTAVLTLVACGNDTSESEEDAASTQAEVETTETTGTATDTTAEAESASVEGTENSEGQKLDENGIVREFPYSPIEGYTIIDAYRETGALTGADIMILELEYTNLGEQPQSPYMSFVSDFDVWQTDGTTTNSLMGANGEFGNLENQEAVEMGDTRVNPGATVNAIIGYQLEYTDYVNFTYRPSQITGENLGFSLEL